jgi:hypothetical protein
MRRSVRASAGSVAVALALACGGAGPPEPEPPPRDVAPAPLPRPGPDRSRHDGLPDAFPSWERFTADTPARPAYMVILWGSTDEEEAWSWLERYWRAGGKMRPGAGYPKVVASKWFEGLNPGFWLVVAAEPVDGAVAGRAESLLTATVLPDLDLSGTYVKEVKAYLPEEDLDPVSLVP